MADTNLNPLNLAASIPATAGRNPAAWGKIILAALIWGTVIVGPVAAGVINLGAPGLKMSGLPGASAANLPLFACDKYQTASAINEKSFKFYGVTPHGHSQLSPADNSGHNTIARNEEGIGEAIDLFIGPPGQIVFAPFTGTAYAMGNSYTQDIVVVTPGDQAIKDVHINGNKTFAVLAHLDVSTYGHKRGDTWAVTAGQPVAKTAKNHLHFELVVNGQSVGGATIKDIWPNMKKVLCLQ